MTDIVCMSPVDGREVARKPAASSAQVEAALAAARKAQAEWKRVSVAERARLCSAAVDAMLAMRAEIAPELSWQMGRPIKYAGGELNGFEERARYMIGIAPEALAPVEPAPKDGFKRYVRRDPLDIVLTVAPWNYPYLTAVNSVIPALMAGNAVLLKHAAQTILVGDRFQAVMDRAGLPRGLFQTLVRSIRSASPARSAPDRRSRRRRPARFPASGSSSAARTRPMCARMPILRMRSRISSTAAISIPASAAAASSESMCMRMCMIVLSKALPI
jgi:acyl-CoA reductase-like NAD-dependent aldehyde dehydrogenase